MKIVDVHLTVLSMVVQDDWDEDDIFMEAVNRLQVDGPSSMDYDVDEYLTEAENAQQSAEREFEIRKDEK